MEELIMPYTCPKCGCKTSYLEEQEKSISGKCTECGEMTFFRMKGSAPPATAPIIECPYCHSKNTRKISTASKVGSVALFGIFSLGKTTKQWHCNKCKSDF